MTSNVGETLPQAPYDESQNTIAKKVNCRESELNEVWNRTLTNLLNYQTGGVLWYATAIAASGWVGHVYSLLLLLCSLMSACMLTELLGKFPAATSYGALCNAALSSQWSKNSLQRARSIMDLFVNLEMYLYLCATIVTLAESLVRVAPAIAGWPAILIATAAILPTTLLKDFKGAAHLSILGIIATAVNVALLAYVSFAGDAGHSVLHPHPDLSGSTDTPHTGASLGLFCVAYSVQSSLPSITLNIRQTSLKMGDGPDQIRPRIRSVVVTSLLLTFIFNTICATAAYMVFGPDQGILPLNFTQKVLSVVACSWVILAYYSKSPRLLFILSDSLLAKAAVPATATEERRTSLDTHVSQDEKKDIEDIEQPTDRQSIQLTGDEATHAFVIAHHISDVETAATTSSTASMSTASRSPQSVQDLTPTITELHTPVQVATTVTFKPAQPAETETRPHSHTVLVRVLLLATGAVVALMSPGVVGLMAVGGTSLAACTMFVVPAFLLAADKGWVNASLFNSIHGGVPAVTAGLVDSSKRKTWTIFVYKMFVYGCVPVLFLGSFVATYAAVLVY